MVVIEADGRITFTIRRPDASSVTLVGAFGGWDEQYVPMERVTCVEEGSDGLWRVQIDPGRGEYLFRYLVDDRQWVLDEEAHGICRTTDGRMKSRVWRPPHTREPDALAA